MQAALLYQIRKRLLRKTTQAAVLRLRKMFLPEVRRHRDPAALLLRRMLLLLEAVAKLLEARLRLFLKILQGAPPNPARVVVLRFPGRVVVYRRRVTVSVYRMHRKAGLLHQAVQRMRASQGQVHQPPMDAHLHREAVVYRRNP